MYKCTHYNTHNNAHNITYLTTHNSTDNSTHNINFFKTKIIFKIITFTDRVLHHSRICPLYLTVFGLHQITGYITQYNMSCPTLEF